MIYPLLVFLLLAAVLLAFFIHIWRRGRREIEVEEVSVSPFGGKSRVELTEEEKELALKKFRGEPLRPLEGEVPTVSEEREPEVPPYEEELEEEGWEERPAVEWPEEKEPVRRKPAAPPGETEEVVFWDEDEEVQWGGEDEVVW